MDDNLSSYDCWMLLGFVDNIHENLESHQLLISVFLYRLVMLAGYKVAPLSLEGELVLREYGCHAPSESPYLQGSGGLARRTLRHAAIDTQT